MEISYLKWDSDFFGKRVFRMNMSDDMSENDIQAVDELQADLIYIFVQNLSPLIKEYLNNIGAILYDRKVTFEKTISPSKKHETIQFESTSKLTPKLVELAYQSGSYSRFKLDPKLNGRYNELYSNWIEKSVNRELADEVIITKNNDGAEIGFITLLRGEDGVGSLGLLAVDEDYRGKRIATQLIDKAEEWFIRNNIARCKVVTQSDNHLACNLYVKLGFREEKTEYIFHYWKTK